MSIPFRDVTFPRSSHRWDMPRALLRSRRNPGFGRLVPGRRVRSSRDEHLQGDGVILTIELSRRLRHLG